MKRFVIFAISLLFAVSALSQVPELSKKEMRKLEKQLKQEEKAREAAERAAVVDLMVKHKTFVLEADRLRDKRGNTVNVSSMINFIAADSISGVLQIGSNTYIGLNGVGGVTVEGHLSNYEYKKNEKSNSYNVSYNLRTTTGVYDVVMTVFSDGRADATVRSNWPGQLNYSGYLVPPAVSKVFKGTPRY